MPDSGIMLELCELLKINVNELLSGERIMAEVYDKRAEENLLAMRREVEEKNRQMLRTEYLIAIPAVIAGLVMVFVASLYRDAGLAANRTYRICSRNDVYGRFYRCGDRAKGWIL